jgi:hypothetical protein
VYPGRGEAEQNAPAQGRDDLGPVVGGVAEDQHVRAVVHRRQKRQRAQELLGAYRDQDQVEAIDGTDLAHAPHRQHGPVARLGILQDQSVDAQIGNPATAGEHDHLVSGLHQLRGVDTADHTDAEHQDPHRRASIRRKAFANAVRRGRRRHRPGTG